MAVLEFINNKLSRTMDPLSDDLQENLDRLVVECLENGCIWGLQDQEGN